MLHDALCCQIKRRYVVVSCLPCVKTDLARGGTSIYSVTAPMFVLGQDKSQRTTTKIEWWSKVKLPFGWTRVNRAVHNRIISVLYITMYSV